MPKPKSLKELADERAAREAAASANSPDTEEVIDGEPVFEDAGSSAATQHSAADDPEVNKSNWVYVTVKTDANGQDYLPGQQPKVIAEFHAKLRERQAIADEHAARAKKLSELNEDISSLGRKYRAEFRQSENKPTVMEYHCGGFLVEVEKTEVEKTTVHKESTKTHTSAAGAGASGGKKPPAPGKDDY